MIAPISTHPSNVLLGVDGSQHCLAGMNLLKALPCVPLSSVKAVSVWNTRNRIDQARLQVALDQACQDMSGGCAEISTELRVGHPAVQLLQAAEEQHPDLIVLGAKGLRATLGILLGGVAQQVVEHAGCAVMVVRAPFEGLREVLLVTDGSETSSEAVEYMADFSLPEGTHVRVAHVTPPLGLADFASGTWPAGHEIVPMLSEPEIAELEKLHEEERQRGRDLLASQVDFLRASGVNADSVLLEGDAATEILRYAKKQHVDLLVAGSRGLSEMRGWLMGSVSRKLVNFAGCSVLIVKRKS